MWRARRRKGDDVGKADDARRAERRRKSDDIGGAGDVGGAMLGRVKRRGGAAPRALTTLGGGEAASAGRNDAGRIERQRLRIHLVYPPRLSTSFIYLVF